MTAFLGYVLPYGQMSLWGKFISYIPLIYVFFLFNFLIYSNSYILFKKSPIYYYYSNEDMMKMLERKIEPDKKFMSMFMGFIDGDGYFDIGEQKQYLKKTKLPAKSTIRLRLASNVHSRDLSLLKYFVDVLGVGKISNMSNRNQVRIIFFKQDLVKIILPLIYKYNLEFLTKERKFQYKLLKYILDNNIIHWENIDLNKVYTNLKINDFNYYVNLDFIHDWIVGFTIAEGSFIIKSNNSASFQIRQTGIEAYEIIKTISIIIAKKEVNIIKPDSSNSYLLTLTSRKDIQNVINFFSPPLKNELKGYKLIQYKDWLEKLRKLKRYQGLNIPN